MNTRIPTRLVQHLRPSGPQHIGIHTPVRVTTPILSQCRRLVYSSSPRGSRPFRDPQSQSTARLPVIRRNASALIVAATALMGLAFAMTSSQVTQISLDAPSSTSAGPSPPASGGRDASLPRYRISEVRKHDAKSGNPWVLYGDKVYDITDWIDAHPGGQVILRAAGGSIEPYWDIFTIHKTQYVYDMLAQYQVGFVHQDDLIDGKPPQEAIEDPFSNDPERHPALIMRTPKPCNAETPREALDGKFITPTDLFYVRNHMWVPTVDHGADEHRLTVELIDGTIKEYSLRDLKSKFPTYTVTAALQCSGNRRNDMNQGSGRSTNGLPWSVGAISNATWEGVRLADVLADAGLDIPTTMAGANEANHVHFSALEAYGASIPIKKAVDPQGDVLLAFSMNGQPLPRDHGFPLRAIVPGHVAARSVKWLSHIGLSDEEIPSQWQRRDYKCFGPNQTEVNWDDAPAIQELPVQSAITSVRLGEWLTKAPSVKENVSAQEPGQQPPRGESTARQVSLGGYAFSGGGRSIIRVDVSLDDGQTWDQAKLVPEDTTGGKITTKSPHHLAHGAWAWKHWRYEGTIPGETFSSKLSAEQEPTKQQAGATQRCTNIVVKATDEAYNTQPESHAATWNLRGNLATAWHRVRVCEDCAPGILKDS